MLRLPPGLCLLPLLLLSGCSPGNFFSNVTTPISAIATPAPSYSAFGDSITRGATLTNPVTQAYPALLAAANSLNLINYGRDSEEACDIANHQIFPNSVSPTNTTKAFYTLIIGTNDLNAPGIGPHEATFTLCHLAAITWLAVPAESKTLSINAISTGPTHTETANNWNALTTDAAGATLTFNLQTTTTGPVYLWYRITDGNPGTFTYALDGSPAGTASTAPAAPISTLNGTSSSLALLRLPAVPPGNHAVRFTQTSPGPAGMGIVAIGAPPSPSNATRPRILVGTLPLAILNGCTPAFVTSCSFYEADITANVALLASDGLNVQFFDSRRYMTGTIADLSDAVHPNPQGQSEIAHAIQDLY